LSWQPTIKQRIRANGPDIVPALESGLEEGGYKGAQRAIADPLASNYRKPVGIIRAYDIVISYIEAGEYDLAIDWLEMAYEKHEPNLPYIGVPQFDPLRSDPRFQDLLCKMNLPADEKE
jgi:hypothetical protein